MIRGEPVKHVVITFLVLIILLALTGVCAYVSKS